MSPRPADRNTQGLLAYIGVGVVIAILLVGIVRLQVVRHTELLNQSEHNRIRVQPIVPKRGVIYDRYKDILVDNRPSYSVSLVRSELTKGKTIPQLSKLIGFDSSLILKRLKNNREPLYLPAVIKRDVGFDKVAILEEQYDKYPGITYELDRVRRYSNGIGAECFTGYVGEVSDAETYSGPLRLRTGSLIGKQGVEKQYDRELRGQEGTRYLEISARGVVLGDLADRPHDPGVAGADLVLTIDKALQREAASMFDTFCCGSIVALDPRNGEVLAMVSEPSYDANIFSGAIPTALWDSIITDKAKPLLNRPLDGTYPPGSPFKLVTAGALLEEKIVTRNSTYSPCLGGWQYGRWFRCWKIAGHGTLNVVDAIAQSCDVYFYQTGLKLGIDKLADYAVRCGFGIPTGIDLPHEKSGLVPNSDTLNAMYPDGWTRALTLNLSIGQGELLVTPLQMAKFFTGLANVGSNSGLVYTPHVLKSAEYPNGVVISPSPELSLRLPFSQSTLKILREGLLKVVHSEHGTAKGIATDEYHTGGKTGTAQNPHGENHSWFAGFAPFEDPKIVVAVIVENGGHGSAVAAPIGGKLMHFYLERLKALADKNTNKNAETAEVN